MHGTLLNPSTSREHQGLMLMSIVCRSGLRLIPKLILTQILYYRYFNYGLSLLWRRIMLSSGILVIYILYIYYYIDLVTSKHIGLIRDLILQLCSELKS